MEKKEIKISLGTFACMMIIVVMLFVILGLGLYIVENNNDDDKQLEQNISVQKDETIGSTNSDLVKKFTEKMQEIKNSEENYALTYTEDGILQAKDSFKGLIYADDTYALEEKDGKYEYNYKNTITDDEVKVIFEKEIESDYFDNIYIETSTSMTEAYIALVFEVEDNTKLEGKAYTPYKINGIDGKIKKVFIAREGQSVEGIYEKVFILMADGTLKYVDCIEGIVTGKFNAYNCEGINNKEGKINDIITVFGEEYRNGEFDGGWAGFIIKKENGDYFYWNLINY